MRVCPQQYFPTVQGHIEAVNRLCFQHLLEHPESDSAMRRTGLTQPFLVTCSAGEEGQGRAEVDTVRVNAAGPQGVAEICMRKL